MDTKELDNLTIPQLYDRVFKRLMYLSKPAIINFINGLFGTNHPPDSELEYINTETVKDTLHKIQGDIIILIGKIFSYLIEAQSTEDNEMAIRIFDYSLRYAIKTKEIKEDVINLNMPNARVVYLASTEKTPEFLTLRLNSPDNTTFDYKVKTFKLQDHKIGELGEKKMFVLLPFCLLKLRSKLKNAKTKEEINDALDELKSYIKEVSDIFNSSEAQGLLTREDVYILVKMLQTLYNRLYASNKEFTEANAMIKDIFWTEADQMIEDAIKKADQRVEEATKKANMKTARNFLQEGISAKKIAKCTGLDLGTIEKLRKELMAKAS